MDGWDTSVTDEAGNVTYMGWIRNEMSMDDGVTGFPQVYVLCRESCDV